MRLNGIFRGIAYSFWLRSRWILLSMVPAALLISIVARHWVGAPWLPWVQMSVAGPYIFAMAFLAGVFTFAGADLGTTESGFPSHMLTLPASTAALVGFPMLIAVSVMGGLWALAAWSFINPLALIVHGTPINVFWPAILVASIIAWLQAITWMPFWFPYVRALLGTVFLLGLGAIGFVGSAREYSPRLLTGFYTAATAMAFPLAVAGLARARRGDGTQIPWSSRRSSDRQAQTAPIARRPFASPLAAQAWFEFRRNAAIIPCIAIAISLFMAVLTVKGGAKITPIPYGPFTFHPIFFALGIALCSPLLAAAMHGAMLGKSDAWSKAITVSPFIAARPLSSAGIITAKLRAAARATVISWAAVLAIIGIWSLFEGVMVPGKSFADYLAPQITGRGLLIAAVVLMFLLVATWKMIAQSLFIYIYGRKWIAATVPVVGMLLFVTIAALGSIAVRKPAALHTARVGLPWIVAGILSIRLAAGGWLFISTPRRGLLTSRQAAWLATAWVLLALAFFVFLVWAIPIERRPSLFILFAMAALFPPGVRTFIALPALHANRHR